MPALDPHSLALREAVGPKSKPRRLHAVIFDNPEVTLRAARRLRGAGFLVADVHSPFPLHGIEEALGWRDTRLPWATFFGALVGLAVGIAFQVWVHAVAWPLNIGGKTDLALPSVLPVAFELAVLLAAFATVGALLVRRRLKPSLSPEVKGQPHPAVNDDRFVVLVVEEDAGFSWERFRDAVGELGAEEIHEGWRVL